MIYQRKFSEGVIERLREKIKTGDEDLISTYLNKEKFNYPFKDEDYKNCDFPPVPEDLGSNMVKTFNNLKNQREDNVVDFRTADFECAKLLYESIKITPRQAADKDFWNYLHHFDLYEYIHLRWNEIENPSRTSTEQYILTHWLMNNTSQKQLVFYPLTGLWWSIHLSKDDSLTDKYALSKIYFNNNRSRTTTFGGSSFVRHKEALLGTLEFLYENQINLNREKGDKIGKFINLLGGTKPLAFFDRNWFKNNLERRFPYMLAKTNDSKNLQRTKQAAKSNFLTNKILPEKISSTEENELLYLNIFNNPSQYFLNTTPTSFSDLTIKIPMHKEDLLLLLCYENGYVNKVPLKVLDQKTVNSDSPYRDLYRESKLIKVLIFKKDSLLFIKGKNYSTGPAGKIYKTEFIPLKDSLAGKGKLLIKKRNIKDYYILPLSLESRLKSIISYGVHVLYNEKEFRKEWQIINNYLKEQQEKVEQNEMPFVDKKDDRTIYEENRIKYIYVDKETGGYSFSANKFDESVISLKLPDNKEKFIFACYNTGEVSKIPLQNLDILKSGQINSSKNFRSGIVHLDVGNSNDHILVSREKFRRTYTKIYKAEWLADCTNINERGRKVVSTTENIKYAVLPNDLPTPLQNIIEIDIKHGVDLNQWLYKQQKELLNKMVPHFFE